MKKKIVAALVGISVLGSVFVGCGSKGTDNKAGSSDKTIVVGAGVTPHAEILRAVEKNLKEKGYNLKVVEYNDYIIPNTALEGGELDANYFQHQPYLDDFNKEKGTHLVSAASVHFEPFGIYAGKTKALADLKEGAKVAIPNDTTNEARALLLLEAQGLIKLKDGAGITATKVDIVENKLNLQIQELEAAQVARALQDVDVACINGNYAIGAGLSVEQALAVEASDSLAAKTYANIIAVKAGNENTDKTKALVEAVTSETAKTFMKDKFKGAVVPVF